ncbi:hypothetical protein OIDMADRAFT_20077 [Oidiodendron maius Zn]|uniref:C2 domain-containing protein n=1 Tax=Oidiodendron maius (strain Zn) TaxID=913774 RepID=A0A0C3H7L6_OIDMZ|nr:hypothetical protein OIDMADRAFT_20077 [Oidiodendron maius Zn]
MCGDSHLPPTPSLGDAVAVIRLQPQLGAITSMPESSWRLQLSNRLVTEEEDNTKLMYEAKPDWWCDDVKLRIHLYGTPSNTREPQNPVLQEMPIRFAKSNSSSVGRKLELHVGEDGVIGRMMSVEVEGRVIGEGVIGRL